MMGDPLSSPPVACFFEKDPTVALGRRAAVEAVGTFLLILVAGGAGSAAAQVAPGHPEIAGFAIAFAIASSLVGLIIAFGEASGGHFNPLITLLQWLTSQRSASCTLAYIGAQVAGGIAGALVARALVRGNGAAMGPSGPDWPSVLSEGIDSAALLTIVMCCARSGRKEVASFAVGAWLLAAILGTPSGSYANPAVVIAAAFAAGPFHLLPADVLAFVPAEIVGAMLALIPTSVAYPLCPATSAAAAEERDNNAEV